MIIDNCVGSENRCHFLIFLMSLISFLITVLSICITHFKKPTIESDGSMAIADKDIPY
jgi:hypothetical protein